MEKRKIFTQYNSVYLILAIICTSAYLYQPSFLGYSNVSLMLRQTVVLGILTMGQVFVISSGGVDLSIVATMQISVAIFMMFVKMWGPEFLALGMICALGVSIIIGLINGVTVAYFNVQPFLSTLFLGTILISVRKVFSGVTPLGTPPKIIMNLTKGDWIISYSVLWYILIIIITAIIVKKTVFGRQVMMVGTNKNAALFSGIKVEKTITIVYIISAILAMIASVVATGHLGFADQTSVGNGMEMDALVAAVLGGNFLTGGNASVSGAVGGVITITIMLNIVVLLGLPIEYQYVLKGLVLLSVMLFSAKSMK